MIIKEVGASMGRRKIEIEPITDSKTRGITFLKRKAGIFKKAHELSVLCGVDVAVVVLGTNGTFYEFSSVDMQELLRYYNDENGMGLAHVVTEPAQYGDYEKTATVKYQVSNGRRNRRGPKARVKSQSVDLRAAMKRERSEVEDSASATGTSAKARKLTHARHNSTGTQLMLHQETDDETMYNESNRRAATEKPASLSDSSNEDDDDNGAEGNDQENGDLKMTRIKSFPQVTNNNHEFHNNQKSAPKVVVNSPPMVTRKDSAPSAYNYMKVATTPGSINNNKNSNASSSNSNNNNAINNNNNGITAGSSLATKRSKPVLKLSIPNSNITTAERFRNQSVPSSPNQGGDKEKSATKNIITTPFQNFNYGGSPSGNKINNSENNKKLNDNDNDNMRSSFSPLVSDRNLYMKNQLRPPFFGSFKNGNNIAYNGNYNNIPTNVNANGMVTGSPTTNQYLATPLQQMNPNRISLYKGVNSSNSGSTLSNATNVANQNGSEVMTPGTGYLFAQKQFYGTLNPGGAQLSNTRETSGKSHHYHNRHIQNQQYYRNNDMDNEEDENNENQNRSDPVNTSLNSGKPVVRATTPIGPDTSAAPTKMNSDFLGNASSPNTSNMLFTDWNLATASNNFGGPNFLNSAGPKSANIFGFMPIPGFQMGGQPSTFSNANNANNYTNGRNMEFSPYLPHMQTPYPGKIFQFNNIDNNSEYPPSSEK